MYTFIVNPTAGNGDAKRVLNMLEAELKRTGAQYSVMHTEHPGHATELARRAAAAEGCCAVIAVGGDGTAYEVASGMAGTGVAFGVIPAGTGNDFIKSTGTPKDPLKALQFILHSTPRPADIGRVNDRMFLNVGGCGFDVTTLDYTLEAKKHFKGVLPYMIGLVRAIRHYEPVHVKLDIDGEKVEQDALICAVANGRFIGGGIPICPAGDISDGKFNLVIIDHKPRWMIPFYLPGLMFGQVLQFGFTRHVLCRRVTIDSPGMRVQIDGEICSMDKAEFELLPAKLLLYW